MRALLRSSIAVVLYAVLSTGCATTGGKVFGATAVVSGIGSVVLMSTSRATLENGQAVLRDDHTDAGAGLAFAAVAAAGGWFLSEYVFGNPLGLIVGGGGGGGGGFPPSADPAGDPVAAPAPGPAPTGDGAASAPVTIVVQAPDPPAQVPLAGWHLDPDGQDRLLDRAGELVIRIDGAGEVWNFGGAALGEVDMSGNCDVSCRRARAHQMLLYWEQQGQPRRPGRARP